MLKEVGASGQISLGKKYAGQLFDMVFYPDGRVELVPMKVVPAVHSDPAATQGVQHAHQVREEAAAYRVGDGWLTPERLALRRAASQRTPEQHQAHRVQWELENKEPLDAMNQRMTKIGSMGRRIREWREAQAASITDPNDAPANAPVTATATVATSTDASTPFPKGRNGAV